jgi:hypothetical protein
LRIANEISGIYDTEPARQTPRFREPPCRPRGRTPEVFVESRPDLHYIP